MYVAFSFQSDEGGRGAKQDMKPLGTLPRGQQAPSGSYGQVPKL